MISAMDTATPVKPSKAEIAEALTGLCKTLGWAPARLAVETETSEQTARSWLKGDNVPSGDALLFLMRKHMVARELLLGRV